MASALAARVPTAWGLRGNPYPAIRRGLLVAAPVGVLLLSELAVDDTVAAGLSTSAMICGFVAFDAPARVRVRWHVLNAPFVGVAAGLGVLSSPSAVLAVATMAVIAVIAGYMVAVSLRMAIGALTTVLALLITQGLFLPVEHTLEATAYGVGGSLVQAATAALAWLCSDREREDFSFAAAWRDTLVRLRTNFTMAKPALRHGLRFGTAMAVGVAIYRVAGFDDHGYWVPLTILFVLKPDPDQTTERILMRAAGTVVGLVLATVLAEVLTNDLIPVVIILTLSAGLAYALLAIEYALFTVAVTVFVVLLTDSLGASPFDAAGERALGTLLGIVVAAVAFKAFGDLDRVEEERHAAATA
jgi:Fusaric acid resistance protein-like